MWHFLCQKNRVWVWKVYCRTTKQLIDWECGNRDSKTLKLMLDRLEKFNVSVFFADNWASYAELFPLKLLVQIKVQRVLIK
ncbi:MAG: hypothetical protein LBH79_07260 [Nitrososphaerota archaeon]|nr:hypothetical protein [Nitrososphaerota archaeon]